MEEFLALVIIVFGVRVMPRCRDKIKWLFDGSGVSRFSFFNSFVDSHRILFWLPEGYLGSR